MQFLFVKFFLITVVSMSAVKGECNSYLDCLGSFFDNFFLKNKNFKTETQVSNVTIPGFNIINIDSDNLNNLLSGVSDFLQEELNGNISFNPQLNVFKSVGNSTAIYVKSLSINNNYGDHILKNIFTNITMKESSDQAANNSDLSIASKVCDQMPFISYQTVSKRGEIDKLKKKMEHNEIVQEDDFLGQYYDMDEDENSTDYLKIDYLEMYKDTTNEFTDLRTTKAPIDIFITKEDDKLNNESKNDTEALFPWVAAIYVKNDTSDQFDYYCDGALLSETVVITAARCMNYYGRKVDTDNVLVLLGKSSLQSMRGTERAVKVKSVILHENFRMEATPVNDIALLLMESVPLSEHIQTACLGSEQGSEAVATGWAILGELTIIPFEADRSLDCKVSKSNTFCAVYGNDVTVCPSYGGIYAMKKGREWYLRGIRSGDPTDRGLCFDRSVSYTDLSYYVEWIDNNSK